MPTAPISDEFEKAFSDLAFAYVNNNAPKLFDYMIGFQIVEKNDEDTKALGVFGFKIGKETYFAPVFFLNGELKGQELLYAKGAKLFFPMEEAWIDYAINKKPTIPGQASENSLGLLGSYIPNFKHMLDSPIHKRSSYATEYNEDGAVYGTTTLGSPFDLRDTQDMWAELHAVHKQACENISLDRVVQEIPQLKEIIAHRAHYYPKFAKALSTFYSAEQLAPEGLKEAAVVEESPAFIDKREVKSASNKKVAFFSTEDSLSQIGVSDGLRTEFLKKGFAVNDTREEMEKSALYDNNIQLTNPTEPGYYQILTIDGALVKCYVSPVEDKYSSEPQVIVIPCPDKYHDFHAKASEVIVLDSYFEKEGPLNKKNLTNNMLDSLGWDRKYTLFLLNSGGKVVKVLSHNRDAIVSDKINSIKEKNYTTMVPKGEKCFQKPYNREGTSKIVLGDWDSISNVDMTKVATSIAVRNVGGSQFKATVGVNETNFTSKLATTKHLITEVGLSKEDADFLVSQAIEKQAGDYYVKLAYPYAVDDYDPYTQFMPVPDVSGYDPAWAVQTANPEEIDMPVQGLPQNPLGDYGELEPDQLESMVASADKNQKEVFDTSALSSLLNTSDVSNSIDKYLKDLVVAIDRIGRILFMMYYHYDMYQERYGSDELFELEDGLKNSFKTTGKLVLFLKQRSIVSDVDDRPIELDGKE